MKTVARGREEGPGRAPAWPPPTPPLHGPAAAGAPLQSVPRLTGGRPAPRRRALRVSLHGAVGTSGLSPHRSRRGSARQSRPPGRGPRPLQPRQEKQQQVGLTQPKSLASPGSMSLHLPKLPSPAPGTCPAGGHTAGRPGYGRQGGGWVSCRARCAAATDPFRAAPRRGARAPVDGARLATPPPFPECRTWGTAKLTPARALVIYSSAKRMMTPLSPSPECSTQKATF